MSRFLYIAFFVVFLLVSCEQQSLEENDSLLTFLGFGIDDTEAPVVTQFTGPATTTSSTVPVSITATDNIHISRWMITESATPPAPTAPGWLLLQPSSYTITSGYGTYELYLWARDGAGNVSALSADTHFTVDYTGTADGTPPVVTYFANTGTDPTNSSLIPVDITATDDVGVTGYIITETAVTPDLADPGWSGVQPASYAISTGYGTYELYVWARDLAGNVSLVNASSHFSITYADLSSPTVTVDQAGGQPDLTNTLPIEFTVVFSKAIDPATFDAGDISQTGTAGAVTWSLATSDNITWTLQAQTVAGNGTVIPSLPASTVQDSFGNGNTASTSTDNIVTYDMQLPVVTSFSGAASTTLNNIAVAFSTNDNIGVTAWMITESSAAPLATDSGWLGVPPSSYTFSGGPGSYTLYLWVKDGAGNVSVMNAASHFTVTYLAASPSPVLQTGQADCYDESGAAISCGSTGQDGELQKGLPWNPATRYNIGIQTFTDNLTGLVWVLDASDSGMVTWDNAFTYIDNLNMSAYGTRTDWRLPNIAELMSLMNFGNSNVSIWFSSLGITVPSAYYWSSTTYSLSPADAWVAAVTIGIKGTMGKSNTNYAWAVAGTSTVLPRTGQTLCYNSSGGAIACGGTGQDGELLMGVAWPSPRFTNNGDGTITDNLSGLMWARDANAMASLYPSFDTDGTSGDGMVTWQHALNYVAMLNGVSYCGYSDWRLPNQNELMSLENQGYGLTWFNDSGFVNADTLTQVFWSSTTYLVSTTYAFVVNDVYGSNGNQMKSGVNYYFVWPVRDGI
ncbi:MAG TPA: DUF1566 domain-containing protein [Spirochaetota bacterium]|nr:DUF1566 domain-containing protein [Spirochaetota bacterium]